MKITPEINLFIEYILEQPNRELTLVDGGTKTEYVIKVEPAHNLSTLTDI